MVIDIKKNYIITFVQTFKSIRQIRFRKKKLIMNHIFIFSYFKVFIATYNILKINRKNNFIVNKFFLKQTYRNKFLNLKIFRKNYFLSSGLFNPTDKKRNPKRKRVQLKLLIRHIFKTYLYFLQKDIKIYYLTINNTITNSLNLFVRSLKFYNKKILKFRYFKLLNIFLIPKKAYGYLKLKKFPRKKRFLQKKKLYL